MSSPAPSGKVDVSLLGPTSMMSSSTNISFRKGSDCQVLVRYSS